MESDFMNAVMFRNNGKFEDSEITVSRIPAGFSKEKILINMHSW